MKKISLNGLENTLSPKEMKNITGGSSYWIACCNSDGPGFSGTANSCDDAEEVAKLVCGGCYAIIGEGCK
jgi:natural product precursor